MSNERLELFLDTISPAPIESEKKIIILCASSHLGKIAHMHIAAHREVVIMTLEQLDQRDHGHKLDVLVVEDLMKQIDTSIQQRIDLDLLFTLPAEKPNNRAGRRGRKFDPLKSTSKFF